MSAPVRYQYVDPRFTGQAQITQALRYLASAAARAPKSYRAMAQLLLQQLLKVSGSPMTGR